MNKKLIWIIVTILIASALIHEVSAIGITPGRTVLEFEPKMQKQITFSVVNTEHKDMKVLLKVDADKELEKDIHLSAEFVEFKASEYSKDFTYTINMDRSSLGRPGDYKADIIAQELASLNDNSGKYVGVSLAVASQIVIRVPFPGKHVSFKLEMSEHPGEVRFFVPIFNLGSEKIEKAKATIDIIGAEEKQIAKLFSNEDSIDAKGRKELTSLWDTREIKPGTYYAIVLLEYDGKFDKYETTFELGEPLVNVKEVNVNNFKLGEVAKFEIKVTSDWQEMIDDLYAELSIKNEDGEIVSVSKSATTQLAPDSETTLEAFWDTAGQESGFYTAVIALHYKGKVKETAVNLEVTLDKIKTSLVSATAQVVSVKESNLKISSTIAIAIIVLIIINFIWFKYLKVKKQELE